MKRVNEILISRMKDATQRIEFIQTGGLKKEKKMAYSVLVRYWATTKHQNSFKLWKWSDERHSS